MPTSPWKPSLTRRRTMSNNEIALVGFALVAYGFITIGWNLARRVTHYMLGGRL